MTTAKKIVCATAIYAAISLVTFGAVSSAAKPECDSRAYDPMKCRVMTAVPAAIFWPFTFAFAAGNMIAQ